MDCCFNKKNHMCRVGFITVTLAFCINLSFAQDLRNALTPHFNPFSEGKFGADNFMRRITDKALMVDGRTVREYEGSPYLSDHFENGEIVTSDAVYKGLVRFNIYSDQIEILHQENIYVVVPDKTIKWVLINARKFIVESFPWKGRTITGFLELVDEGAIDLCAKKLVIYKERQEPSGMQYSVRPAKFENLSDQYFAKNPNGEVKKIPTLKTALAILSDRRTEAEGYVSREGLRNRPEDIVLLIKYYNTITRNLHNQ
jgi:hypothetical protein